VEGRATREHGVVVCECGSTTHNRDATAKAGLVLAAAAVAEARRAEREVPHGRGTGGDGDEWIRLGFHKLYTLRGI
jgi:hypothetical protein